MYTQSGSSPAGAFRWSSRPQRLAPITELSFMLSGRCPALAQVESSAQFLSLEGSK